MLTRRQLAWLVHQHFKLTDTEGAILEFEDLLQVELKGANLRKFLNDWEMTLESLGVIPSEK